MESLPPELYDAILVHLHLIDLAKLRRVCKKFRSIVQEYRIKELHSCSCWYSRVADLGEYQNSPIHRPRNMKNVLWDSIEIFENNKYKRFLITNIFLKSGHFNVRCLRSLSCVLTKEEGAVRLSDINKLVLLERLELDFSYGVPSEDDQKLSLPNLKTFLLLRCIRDFALEVDAPKCEGFHFENHSNVYLDRIRQDGQYVRLEFKHPDSVKYLSLYRYHRKAHVFRNVEFLQISSTSLADEEFSPASLIDEQLFAAFPRLSTLKIMNYGSLEELRKLVRMKNLLRGQSLTMFFHGIRLVDGSELDAFEEKDFEFCKETKQFRIHSIPGQFSAQIRNYAKLDDGLNFVTKIVLTDRVAEGVFKHFAADSGRFLRIFDNVVVICSEVKIKGAELFLRFLASFGVLLRLSISNSGLGQAWYDRLLHHLESVQTLLFLEVEEEEEIDLSFACRFPGLRGLKTNEEIIKSGPEFRWNNFIHCWQKPDDCWHKQRSQTK